MIGGNSRVNLDVPPFFLYSGFDVTPVKVNTVGLRRAGFSPDEIAALKRAYRLLYRTGLKLETALERIGIECPTSHTEELVAFVRSSKRGICRPVGRPESTSDAFRRYSS